MSDESPTRETVESDTERNFRIVDMRDGGAAWNQIQTVFGMTRQQARYAYQLGKRAERRGKRPLS